MSIFDAPQYDLNPAIWANDNDKYVLRERIKRFIGDRVQKSISENLCAIEQWVEDIVLFGSLTTNQYHPKSNLDLGVIISVDNFTKHNPYFKDKEDKQILKLIKSILENAFNSHTLTDSINDIIPHVIESDALFLGDSIYSITNATWLKKPLMISWKFDPWEAFSKEIKYCMALSKYIFPLVSEARILCMMYLKTSRGYDKLIEAMKILAYVENVLRVFRERKNSSDSFFPAYDHSNNWEYHNVIYKILQSWKISSPTEYILKEFPELKDVIRGIKAEFNFQEDTINSAVDRLEDSYFNTR